MVALSAQESGYKMDIVRKQQVKNGSISLGITAMGSGAVSIVQPHQLMQNAYIL